MWEREGKIHESKEELFVFYYHREKVKMGGEKKKKQGGGSLGSHTLRTAPPYIYIEFKKCVLSFPLSNQKLPCVLRLRAISVFSLCLIWTNVVTDMGVSLLLTREDSLFNHGIWVKSMFYMSF